MKPNRAWIWLAVAICGVTFLLSGTASAEKQGKSEAAERVSSNGEDDINCKIVIQKNGEFFYFVNLILIIFSF